MFSVEEKELVYKKLSAYDYIHSSLSIVDNGFKKGGVIYAIKYETDQRGTENYFDSYDVL